MLIFVGRIRNISFDFIELLLAISNGIDKSRAAKPEFCPPDTVGIRMRFLISGSGHSNTAECFSAARQSLGHVIGKIGFIAGIGWLILMPFQLLGEEQSKDTKTQLLMLEQAGCVYCAQFNDEIGQAYAKTTEGATAPLRRIDLDAPWPDDLPALQFDYFTPQFILVHNGREIDRLVGYPGDNFFWFLLGEMLEKLPDNK